MFEPKLSKAQKQLLSNQAIDVAQPGSVLRDFAVLLHFVGTEGLKAPGKGNLFPMDRIAEIDEQLSRPLRLEMKRPQLRSHPYLQGLYLLLRASGLSRVEGTGAKGRMMLDSKVLEQWEALNPAEQYFTLLEAGLLRGRPEMVGEKSHWSSDYLRNCLRNWQWLPADGRRFGESKSQRAYLPVIGNEMASVALMDLFGLWQVEHSRQPVVPWRPTGLQHLPFGDAVMTLLYEQEYHSPVDRIAEEVADSAKAIPLGRWQPVFQPYFPEWRNNLVLPGVEARQGVYVFRFSLGRAWWRLAVPADATLDDLVGWILDALDFDHDHLYEFTYRDRFGAMIRVNDPRIDEGPWADDVLLGELPVNPGQSLSLLYDFGDSWKIDVKLEAIEPPGTKMEAPKLLESHGQAPKQYGEWEGEFSEDE